MAETPSASDRQAYQETLKAAFDLHNAGRHTEAEAACRSLLEQNPQDAQLRFLLGMVLKQLNRPEEALVQLETAAALQPQSARIFNGLGFVHQSLKNYQAAVTHYTRALSLGMQSADTFYSLGNACHALGRVEAAADCFRQAVTRAPNDAASWNNLGKCLNDLNQLPESLAAYDRALAIDPHYSLARYGRALSLLAAGRLPEGFREYNQWRRHGITPREFPQPRWEGETIPGNTLFLHAEQGFGDAIQYARFLPVVHARAGRVILECRPELKTLFVSSGIADAVIAFGEEIPPFDYFTSQASLPGILGVALDTIPNHVPYLKTPPLVNHRPDPSEKLKVGLVWAGNSNHHNDHARSMTLATLLPLQGVPGVSFHSLQVPLPARDEACFRAWPDMVNPGIHCHDFLATAAAVAQLDLVISVDTAVAHLAGALAKPVWTLLPYAPDWRWMLDRQDTPWYPTMRLHRQGPDRDWAPVVRCVVDKLHQLANPLPAATPPTKTPPDFVRN